MMVDLFRTTAESLSDAMLHRWHAMMLGGRRDLGNIGAYRAHDDPMQIVSGAVRAPKVHYEAPPSRAVASEMGVFIKWINRTAPSGQEPLPSIERAGLAHLWFECVHSFEDGNGRIGRAISEKALHGAAAIGEMHRKETEWMPAATRDLANGKLGGAFAVYANAGIVHGAARRDDARILVRPGLNAHTDVALSRHRSGRASIMGAMICGWSDPYAVGGGGIGHAVIGWPPIACLCFGASSQKIVAEAIGDSFIFGSILKAGPSELQSQTGCPPLTVDQSASQRRATMGLG